MFGTLLVLAVGIAVGANQQKIRAFVGNLIHDWEHKDK